MNHNDELVEELRTLRLRLAREVIAMQTAREAYDEQKREVADLRKAIEEVLAEIETGATGRPILDAANGSGGAAVAGAAEPAGSTAAWSLASAREAIDEHEGPAGDGATRVCLRCRAGMPASAESCPRCAYRITRMACGLLEELGATDGAARRKRKGVAG